MEQQETMMSRPWFYPDRVSAISGDRVAIHASSACARCELIVSRVGQEWVEMARFELSNVPFVECPSNSDSVGCHWPIVFEFVVKDGWTTGYYDLALVDAKGQSSHHFICIRKASNAAKSNAVMVLSTNTYFAYNYWGGSNAYANVVDLLADKITPDESRGGAIGRLSRQRPFAQAMINPPEGAPRLINLEPRGLGEMGFPGDLAWMEANQPSPYDGSACFINKWEHKFAGWLEANDYDVDYITDHDFETDTDPLEGYNAALFVGHSEYWSAKQRLSTERYSDSGGHLIVFSGNTCYWKVRWEDNGETLIAHKTKGERDDPLWRDAATRKDATQLWSHEAFGQPEASLIGLSFLYGGYHRLGMCVARGSAGFTIYDDSHWALEGTDLFYGDVVGGDLPLVGYENDGCPIKFGADGLPVPDGGLGVPANLKIIGIAPATLAESDRNPFPALVPKEDVELLARIAYGSADHNNIERLMRGHAVIASFERGLGEVFNSGTTEWVHGLAARDPFVEAISLNVFRRFGVIDQP